MRYHYLGSNNINKLNEGLYMCMSEVLLLPGVFPSKKIREESQSIIFQTHSPGELSENIHSLIETILGEIELPEPDRLMSEIRLKCPLCGSSSQTTYVEGYKYPEGLRRHLSGFGNMSQCFITNIIIELALHHIGMRTRKK